MRILCEAVSFGFGPVSKLLSLCELLSLRHSLDFVGSGCSLALADKADIFENIIEFDTTTSIDIQKAVSFSEYDMVISVMNPSFGKVAIEHGRKLVIVDSLFYMWNKIDSVWKECTLLIIQSFCGEESRLQTTDRLPNARLVGPIVSTRMPQRNTCDKNSLVINFGGADYPYVKDFSKILSFIKNIAIPLSSLKGFDEKVISIGPRCLKDLQELRYYGFEIKTFSHNEFLAYLANTRMLLTIPGLTTTFEAFHLSTPILFLPPLNFSQFLNLRTFRSLGLANMGSHWDDYFPEITTNNLSEEQGVQLVESLVSKALDGAEVIPKIVKTYEIALKDEVNPQSIIATQKEFYESVGGCGTYDAVKLIEGVLSDGSCMATCERE